MVLVQVVEQKRLGPEGQRALRDLVRDGVADACARWLGLWGWGGASVRLWGRPTTPTYLEPPFNQSTKV